MTDTAAAMHTAARYDRAAADLRNLSAVVARIDGLDRTRVRPYENDLLDGQLDDARDDAQRLMALLLAPATATVFRVYGWDDMGDSLMLDVVADDEEAAITALAFRFSDVNLVDRV